MIYCVPPLLHTVFVRWFLHVAIQLTLTLHGGIHSFIHLDGRVLLLLIITIQPHGMAYTTKATMAGHDLYVISQHGMVYTPMAPLAWQIKCHGPIPIA